MSCIEKINSFRKITYDEIDDFIDKTFDDVEQRIDIKMCLDYELCRFFISSLRDYTDEDISHEVKYFMTYSYMGKKGK